jgi:hypothetical protein
VCPRKRDLPPMAFRSAECNNANKINHPRGLGRMSPMPSGPSRLSTGFGLSFMRARQCPPRAAVVDPILPALALRPEAASDPNDVGTCALLNP